MPVLACTIGREIPGAVQQDPREQDHCCNQFGTFEPVVWLIPVLWADVDLSLVRSCHAVRECTETCRFAGSERGPCYAERFWGKSRVFKLHSTRRDGGHVLNSDSLGSIPPLRPLRPVLTP